MSNDDLSIETDDIFQDEEVNCVFCGKLFPSIEKVQEHIADKHESSEAHTETIDVKQEPNFESKLTKIYDLNTEPVPHRMVDFNNVVQCSKCELSFVHAYASRMHFEKVHLIRKRKRSSNPNGVEGIIVSPNGSDNWGCDICGRQFPTLKQAKVHKFKSHIEPVQKKKLMLHRNIIRKSSASQRNLVKKYIAENKFREILPNSKKSKIDKSRIEQGQSVNNEEESGCHGDQNNPDSYSASDTGRPATNLWRAAQSNSRGNKIVLSRVYSITNQNELNINGSRNRYGRFRKRAFVCFYCQSIFLNREGFKRHLLMHRKNESFKCVNCDLKFIRLKMLKQHQKEHCRPNFIKSLNNIAESNGKPPLAIAPAPKADKWKLNQSDLEKPLLSPIKSEAVVIKNVISQNDTDATFQKNMKFAEKFLNNPAITLNKGSQCVCNLCQSCFYSNNSILKHLVLHHRIAIQDGYTALSISKCESVAKLKPLLNETVNDLSTPTTKPILHFIHNCEHCSSQFASKKGLQRHLHSVHVDQGIDVKYDSGVDLSKRSLDENPLKFVCSDCGMSFHDNKSLILHRDDCSGWSSSSGGTGRRVKCDICRKRFRNPLTLDEHRRLHENESCINSIAETDGIATNDKATAGENTTFPRIKTEEYILSKPAASPANNKKVSTYSIPTYKKAKVPPNADGLFECDECHKTFTCRSSLSNHVKSHFNFKNKPFSCSACNQGFMSTLTLQYHRQQLCPNINREEINEQEVNNSNSLELVPQQNIYSSFDGVSQVPGSNYSSVSNAGDSGSSLYTSSTNNLTTRATSCMHCNAMFPDRSLLEDHASKEHSNHAGEVVCIICPRSFTTYMAFRVHMTKSHGGPNGTSLKSHLNAASIHKANTSFEMIQELSSSLSKERPSSSLNTSNGKVFHSRHACPNCDKDFSTSQALGNHKRACMPHLYKKVNL